MFPTAGTVVAAFTVVKKSQLAHEGNIFDDGGSVIMDLISDRMTVWASVRFSF